MNVPFPVLTSGFARHPESFQRSRDGFILTNNHVVERATEVKVKLESGKECGAKVIVRDPKTDILGGIPVLNAKTSDTEAIVTGACRPLKNGSA